MKRLLIGLAAILALTSMAAAQAATTQRLVLEFVDGDALTVVKADKSILKLGAGIAEGDAIPVGATITTGPTTTAELKLTPNGTVIKLAKSTSFAVTGLASSAQDKNAFALVAGKVRAVAAKGGNYTVATPTAVCGVRGTDFFVEVVEGSKELLAVLNGEVEFTKVDAAGKELAKLAVGAGKAADAFAASFAAVDFDFSDFSDMVFQKLDSLAVPQAAAEAGSALAKGASEMSKDEVESAFAKWLREALGMEIGSVTINGDTYSKAVIQPNLKLGKLKLGLYLPIIYTSDLFDPADWYRPDGNDEWSFGAGLWADEPVDAVVDAARDLALKIKYVEYGTQLEDPFFVKIGNLDSLTIGHGLIMRNYANNTEFPAIRRIGFNLGVDSGKSGFEILANDLAKPEIFGGRFFFRPVEGSKVAFGVSAAADLYPASDLYVGSGASVDKTAAEALGDPLFITTGVDLDIPIVSSGLLGLRAFADAAATLPWTRTAVGANDAGPQFQFVYADGSIRNWGAAAGFMGKVLFIDWRLEYRYYTGIFRPAFFDTTYDKNRAAYVDQYAGYLDGSETFADTPSVMGIYGEAGFGFMKNAKGEAKLGFDLAYAWPFVPGGTLEDQLVLSTDELHARLYVRKGLIPIFDVSGAISYDRRGLAAAIADGGAKLIDEKTTFGGELVVPVPKTPNLDVAVVFATVPVRNADGSIVWANPGTDTIPELKPSITFETRFHF